MGFKYNYNGVIYTQSNAPSFNFIDDRCAAGLMHYLPVHPVPRKVQVALENFGSERIVEIW